MPEPNPQRFERIALGKALQSLEGEYIMQNEVKSEATQRLPLQAVPVMRVVVNSAISSDAGGQACDMDHINIFKNCP